MTRMVMCSNPSLASSLDICLGTCYRRLGQDESQFPGVWALTISLLYNSTVSQQTAAHCTNEFYALLPFHFGPKEVVVTQFLFSLYFLPSRKNAPIPYSSTSQMWSLSSISMTGEPVRNAKPRAPPQAYKWESHILQLWPGAQEPVFILLVILMQLKCENHLPSYRVERGCPAYANCACGTSTSVS